jgi:hypothetical protein
MRNYPEHTIQVAICHYLDLIKIPYFAIPNGGKRPDRTGKRLVKEGMKSGVADLFLLIPNKIFNGLFIEVKSATGRQQESQKDFEKLAFDSGYCYELVRSLDDLIKCLETYKKIR